MAVLGLTKLAAVNEIARARGEPPFSQLDPNGAEGSSEQAEIERLLDTETRRVIEQEEWPECVSYGYALTAAGAIAGGNQKITVPPLTLWIRGVAPKQYSQVTLRGDRVWDMNRHTDDFPIGTTIYVDLARTIPFEELSPPLKDHIAALAAKLYARSVVNEPQREGLREDAAKHDLSARRFGPQSERRPLITGPLEGRFTPDEPRRS